MLKIDCGNKSWDEVKKVIDNVTKILGYKPRYESYDSYEGLSACHAYDKTYYRFLIDGDNFVKNCREYAVITRELRFDETYIGKELMNLFCSSKLDMISGSNMLKVTVETNDTITEYAVDGLSKHIIDDVTKSLDLQMDALPGVRIRNKFKEKDTINV